MTAKLRPVPNAGTAADDPLIERLSPHIAFRNAEEIAPSSPEWLWRRWLLLRALNLLAGRQGSGKTTWVAYIVAALTRGLPLPGDEGGRPKRVAWLSLEEPDDRVVARLEAAGAELSQIVVLGDVQDVDEEGRTYSRRWALPRDISILGKVVQDQHIALVVIDGLGYSIAGDSHNYAVVGSALSALAGEAERTGAAVLGLVHPPKGSSDPVTAAIGSTAWTAIPRISIVLGVDPSDESGERRVVSVGKSNYKMPDSGYSFRIGNDERWECGFVMGMTPSNIAAEEITAAAPTTEEKGERVDAREVLRELLAGGPMDAVDALRASGVAERTLKRARKDLGVIALAKRNAHGHVTGWSWSLPQGHEANTRVPSSDLALWPSGSDQGVNTLSLQGGQRGEAGTLALDSAE
ncbi:MAG: hypothetical protein JWM85_2231 [Acidimicrobiaceae bacterium]|nr:hypothetical protein [Acidimicrobiaceae bacterium]